jgi:hypothetical protein
MDGELGQVTKAAACPGTCTGVGLVPGTSPACEAFPEGQVEECCRLDGRGDYTSDDGCHWIEDSGPPGTYFGHEGCGEGQFQVGAQTGCPFSLSKRCSKCADCPAGRYKAPGCSKSGEEACVPDADCPVAHWCPGDGTVHPCPVGTHGRADGQVGMPNQTAACPEACPSGFIAANARTGVVSLQDLDCMTSADYCLQDPRRYLVNDVCFNLACGVVSEENVHDTPGAHTLQNGDTVYYEQREGVHQTNCVWQVECSTPGQPATVTIVSSSTEEGFDFINLWSNKSLVTNCYGFVGDPFNDICPPSFGDKESFSGTNSFQGAVVGVAAVQFISDSYAVGENAHLNFTVRC